MSTSRISKYASVFNIGLQNTFVYRWNYFLRALFGLIPLAGTVFLWSAVFKERGGGLHGYDYGSMIYYYLLTILVSNLVVPAEDEFQIAADIREGQINALLTKFLRSRGINAPRVAIAGLNPHAGESGKLGGEEIEIIAPAIEDLNSSPVTHSSFVFTGPVSPDTVFNRAIEGEFDAVLCMYHDQGLIPLKLHAFHSGVNVTLGLPFPRTSPDHGTAFEIAGKGIARLDSMIAAITLAVELACRGADRTAARATVRDRRYS